MINLMREFIKFRRVVEECNQGFACLTSPARFQELLEQADRIRGGSR